MPSDSSHLSCCWHLPLKARRGRKLWQEVKRELDTEQQVSDETICAVLWRDAAGGNHLYLSRQAGTPLGLAVQEHYPDLADYWWLEKEEIGWLAVAVQGGVVCSERKGLSDSELLATLRQHQDLPLLSSRTAELRSFVQWSQWLELDASALEHLKTGFRLRPAVAMKAPVTRRLLAVAAGLLIAVSVFVFATAGLAPVDVPAALDESEVALAEIALDEVVPALPVQAKDDLSDLLRTIVLVGLQARQKGAAETSFSFDGEQLCWLVTPSRHLAHELKPSGTNRSSCLSGDETPQWLESLRYQVPLPCLGGEDESDSCVSSVLPDLPELEAMLYPQESEQGDDQLWYLVPQSPWLWWQLASVLEAEPHRLRVKSLQAFMDANWRLVATGLRLLPAPEPEVGLHG